MKIVRVGVENENTECKKKNYISQTFFFFEVPASPIFTSSYISNP